jgi:hypothetical protein
MVVDQATFQIGQRVRIISSGSTATIEATFTLVRGYYDVCLDGRVTHCIAFETDLEMLDLAEDGVGLPDLSPAA